MTTNPRMLAAQAGEYIYFDKPCKNGHTEGRYTKTGSCVTCTRARSNAYHQQFVDALGQAKAAKAEQPA